MDHFFLTRKRRKKIDHLTSLIIFRCIGCEQRQILRFVTFIMIEMK